MNKTEILRCNKRTHIPDFITTVKDYRTKSLEYVERMRIPKILFL